LEDNEREAATAVTRVTEELRAREAELTAIEQRLSQLSDADSGEREQGNVDELAAQLMAQAAVVEDTEAELRVVRDELRTTLRERDRAEQRARTISEETAEALAARERAVKRVNELEAELKDAQRALAERPVGYEDPLQIITSATDARARVLAEEEINALLHDE
ncbi:MAG TPA: hypothetical protein VG223_01535, partial [Solirubrobacteraceae bacterium]|nr:hypothetical protein [Solirubrobacteraceae bacterium]